MWKSIIRYKLAVTEMFIINIICFHYFIFESEHSISGLIMREMALASL